MGVLVAKALGMDFLDTDILIQQKEQKKLQEIIDMEGVNRFLETEERIVGNVCVENTVIATGGSVVYSPRIMEILRKNGIVIYLSLPYEELRRRLTDITTRGIVMKNGESLRDVYQERLPLYQHYADLTVDCEGKSIERCVEELLAALS